MIYLLLAIGGVQSVITTAIFLSFPKKENKILKTILLIAISLTIYFFIAKFLLQLDPSQRYY
jgi:hypothetical protein